MNTDIRVAVDFWEHPKTLKLVRTLGLEGPVCLMRLWMYTAKFRPEGVLLDMEASDIAEAARWHGDPDKFVRILCDRGWLDRDGERYVVHDWTEHQPWAIKAPERSQRAKQAAVAKWGASDSGQSNKNIRSARLTEAKKKGNHTQTQWEEMRSFFGTCVKCEGSSGLLHVDRDHIIPIYQGGSHGIDNIQPLCARCNASKGPENIDYRKRYCELRNIEMPLKWLPSACVKQASSSDRMSTQMHTPNAQMHTPSPSPSPLPTPKEETKILSASKTPDAVHAQSGFYVTKKKRKLAGKRFETFLQFWKAFGYPKGKAEAADAWMDIPELTNGEFARILAAAQMEAELRPKLIADGRTPKMAQGWIAGRRWEDEAEQRPLTWSERKEIEIAEQAGQPQGA